MQATPIWSGRPRPLKRCNPRVFKLCIAAYSLELHLRRGPVERTHCQEAAPVKQRYNPPAVRTMKNAIPATGRSGAIQGIAFRALIPTPCQGTGAVFSSAGRVEESRKRFIQRFYKRKKRMAGLYTIPNMRVKPAIGGPGNRTKGLVYDRQISARQQSCRPERPRPPLAGLPKGLKYSPAGQFRVRKLVCGVDFRFFAFAQNDSNYNAIARNRHAVYFFALCPCAIIAKPLDGAGLAACRGIGRGLRSRSFPAADRQRWQ